MVHTLIDHRNDVIKCSKLKWWNHEPRASGFTAKFWTIYGVISMVYKSVDHGNMSVVDLFFTMTFIFCFLWSFSQTARSDVFFVVVFRIFFCIFAASETNSLSEMSPHMLKFGSSLSMLRSKIVFMKNQSQNNRHCVTCYVISMVYTLIDHGSRPFSARGLAQLL